MDLSTIKKNVENVVIYKTEDFQRAMLVMFSNAVMYNNADHEVHQMALEMASDVIRHMEDLLPESEQMFSADAAHYSGLNPVYEAAITSRSKSLRSRSSGVTATTPGAKE